MGIQQQLGANAPKPNAIQRIVQKVAASRGRRRSTELLTGLPIMMLTTTGAKTGQARTHPVLGIPHGDDYALQSGNFGVKSVPAWVHNLRANPAATVQYGGTTAAVTARKADDEETDAILSIGTELFPGLAAYGRRASRQLDVFVLTASDGS